MLRTCMRVCLLAYVCMCVKKVKCSSRSNPSSLVLLLQYMVKRVYYTFPSNVNEYKRDTEWAGKGTCSATSYYYNFIVHVVWLFNRQNCSVSNRNCILHIKKRERKQKAINVRSYLLASFSGHRLNFILMMHSIQ